MRAQATAPEMRVIERLGMRAAQSAAAGVVFVGPNANHASKIDAGSRLRTVGTLREASAYLRRTLHAGDLVLIKGSKRADHMQRIVLAQTRGVRCWREACRLDTYCDASPLLDVPEEAALTSEEEGY
jgi:UDP-N-acetylmuramoyl-tripeptide--D-alanyl-D-alanine ligase